MKEHWKLNLSILNKKYKFIYKKKRRLFSFLDSSYSYTMSFAVLSIHEKIRGTTHDTNGEKFL